MTKGTRAFRLIISILLGITMLWTAFMSYAFIYVTKENGAYFACLRKHVSDIDVVTQACPIDYRGLVRLKIVANDEWYSFYYESKGQFVELGRGTTALLCTETNGRSFTGTFLGIFTENGTITVKNATLKEL